MRELYTGEVAHVDESFGALIEQLQRDGLYDRTAIVLVADHGEEFHDHGGWWHGTTLYDEQINVPLVVKWPSGTTDVGTMARPTGNARQLDVAPTVVAIAGVAPPSTWQGQDLKRGIPADQSVFSEEDHEGNVLAAVQTGQKKLIEANAGNPRGLAPRELYDLQADPHETQNLAATRPEDATRLAATLIELHGRAAQQAVAGSEAEMDETMRARLRALGYVQ
jgi:arylsulfatase A-like enzyme